MDRINVILTALVTGATEALNPAAPQGLKDSYAGLKALIQQTYGQQSDLLDAVAKVENRPNSEARQGALKEELQLARVEQDRDMVTAALQLLDLLMPHGQAAGRSIAILSGSGAIAQGVRSVAAGRGGVAVGGDVKGSIITSGSHISGDYVGGDKVLGDKIEPQVNTGGGAFVEGSVKISDGDFVGRDQSNYGDPQTSGAGLSPEGRQLAALLNDYFSEEELRDICEQFEQSGDRIHMKDKQGTAKALVVALEQNGELQQHKLLMRVARPQLRSQLS
jgi:hypothetical protein